MPFLRGGSCLGLLQFRHNFVEKSEMLIYKYFYQKRSWGLPIGL